MAGPTRVRYIGPTRPLYVLWGMIELAGLTRELMAGPTPYVSLLVHTHHLDDGLDRLHEVLAAWRRLYGHGADAEVIPLT